MNGDFILDGGSLVTLKQKRDKNADESGISESLPRSGWMQARSMAARATPHTARAASPNGASRL